MREIRQIIRNIERYGQQKVTIEFLLFIFNVDRDRSDSYCRRRIDEQLGFYGLKSFSEDWLTALPRDGYLVINKDK